MPIWPWAYSAASFALVPVPQGERSAMWSPKITTFFMVHPGVVVEQYGSARSTEVISSVGCLIFTSSLTCFTSCIPKRVSSWMFSGVTVLPICERSTRAKKLPPKEISYLIFLPSITVVRFSLYKKAGTFVSVTFKTFPFLTSAFVRINPAGASNTTSV